MKRLTVVNRTAHVLTVGRHGSEEQIIQTSKSVTLMLSASSDIRLGFRIDNLCDEKLKYDISTDAFEINIPLALGASWKMVRTEERCPWRIYRSKVAQRHDQFLVLPRRNLSSFLAEMPDSLRLSALLLPGTHDTMAFYGWPISQCQSLATPLEVQLRSGIRVLDVRLSIIDGRLIAYHGLYPQHAPFQYILSIVHDFLTSPEGSRETLVMSIKQEDFMYMPLALFSQLIHKEIFEGPGGGDMWFFRNRVPKLGEVRGKVVLFSRFGGDGEGWEGGLEGLGIHPTTWPDSAKEGFEWYCKGTWVRTQDWYQIPSFLSIPEKVKLSTEILLQPEARPPYHPLNITYFSASSFPLANPSTVAQGFGWPRWGLGVEGVNARVGKWLVDMLGGSAGSANGEKHAELEEPRIRGWTLMDFIRDPEECAIVPLLVECNFRARKAGEEDWPTS